jgi:murein DD-endopeptidase MepM/ murein hydrolase activator NlpD
MEPERRLTFLVVPESGGKTRSLRISYRRLPWIMAGAGALFFFFVLLVGSWWYLAARTHQAALLEERVAELVAREARVDELARTLTEVEEAYAQIRDLFGAGTLPAAEEIWLPPAAGRPSGSARLTDDEQSLPTSWPLTEGGFVTQTLLEGAGSDHPGIDIAVPSGSYIRAAGSGLVSDAGEDPIYGWYLVLEHGEGYRTRYAHASLILVKTGDVVERNEIVALSGSSGRSSAPHLHFEIFLEGEALDPLTMVTEP